MLDNLKNHIDNNRDEFEVYPFDNSKGWEGVAEGITSSNKGVGWRIAGLAACVLFVIMGSMYQLNSSKEVNTELVEMEAYYATEINQKMQIIQAQLKDPVLIEDLKMMDQAFMELKTDLKENIDNEEVIQAMMENYQLKLQILEEILLELNKESGEAHL